jgi:AbiV family abortive infection protein
LLVLLLTKKRYDEFHEAVIENAAALIDDAELLFANDRLPTAFALSVLATEEAAKGMLLWQHRPGRLPKLIDLKRVNKSLRDHEVKLAVPRLIAFALKRRTDTGDDGGVAAIEKDLPEVYKQARSSDRAKQRSFYVSFDGGKAKTPTRAISRKLVESNLAIARALVDLIVFVHTFADEKKS